jgi:hypothetical protein
MKKKYFNVNQNVYQEYTGTGSRVITELVCIATSEENAEAIVKSLKITKVN